MSFGPPISVRSSRGKYRVIETPREALFQGIDAVVTDANVAAALGPIPVPHLVLPAGEATKSLTHFGEVLSWMAGQGLHRRSILGALGGGVVGDLAGFAAASYMRGIRYIQIPTTLLAMVDSSVGGKVAIDLPEGKNLAGAFHPPIEVRLNFELIGTGPWWSGMAEVIKYGLILDTELERMLAEEELRPAGDRYTPYDPRLPQIVRRCIELKRDVVEADEDETLGTRALLNFGHTIGHAVEVVTGYGEWSHGDAVAMGMALETRLGERLGMTEHGTQTRVNRLLCSHHLPTSLPNDVVPDDLIGAMRRDKKARDGRLAFALLESVGSARLVEDVDEALVREVLAS